MADKSIEQLNEAEKIYASDLFVLQQSGAAKKLSGNALKNWLLEIADSLGGISKIEKIGTSGLVDTYRITFANDTTWTYTITNGAKGDKGDNVYTWIKYASQQPTEASHSMGDIPDAWRGEYNGTSATAPTDWKQYKWYKIKGEKGNTGDPARLTGSATTYMVADSGTVIPSGSWQSSVPSVPQGKYLWTRVVQNFNTGSPVISYSVSRMGLDGSGAVSAVNEQTPDSNGNVTLDASNIRADSGQSIQAELNSKQAKITASGLLKGGGDGTVSAAAHGTDYQLPIVSVAVTLPASGWTGNAQTVTVSGVTAAGSVVVAPTPGSFAAYNEAAVRATGQGTNTLTFGCEDTPAENLNVNVMIINK